MNENLKTTLTGVAIILGVLGMILLAAPWYVRYAAWVAK